jgi:hypothetical protein
MFRYRSLSLVIVGVLLSLGSGLLASAAPKPPTGITVSPAFQKIKILNSDTEVPVQFTITNNEPTTQSLRLSAADFNSLNESGGLLFIGTNPTALQKKYGLAKWLSLAQASITLAPKQVTVIKATILNQSDLSPGGHYGALMLNFQTSGFGKNGNHVAVNPIASSLIFVNKIGGDTHRLKLSGVDIKRKAFSLPSSVTLRFYNDGNTDVTPRGVVTITNGSKFIKKGIVNETSGLVLPETYRRYVVVLNKISEPALIGRATLNINYRFDGYDGFRTYQTHFFYISEAGVFVIAALLIALWLLGWRLLKHPAFRASAKQFIQKRSRK